MIARILVPVDGSTLASHAVDFASDLAEKYGAAMTLIHVSTRLDSSVPPELEAYARIEHLEVDERNLLEGVSRQILEEAAVRARRLGVGDVSEVVEVGDPARKIIEYAEKNDIDVIVIGSRGLGDAAGLLLGSVSHKVTHLAKCPCVIVK